MTMTDPNDVRRQFEAAMCAAGIRSANEKLWNWVGYQAALQSSAVRELESEATRALNWLASYPGGGAIGCYDRLRAALRTLGAGHVE